MTSKPFSVRFWGARGTMASSTSETDKYGGNTACVEVTCGEETLILDAGSGLRMLGNKLGKSSGLKLNLFFTHCHYDHISGLPFFAPFYNPSNSISIWSGHLPGPDKTERMISSYMQPPFFPVGPEVFSSKLLHNDFEPGDTLRPCKGVVLKTIELDHHDGCVGYRIEFDKRSICYITDTNHSAKGITETITQLVRGTDLMIYDGTYSDSEYEQFKDFGHSTWEEGVRICQAADVQRYCIFHHRPSRTDVALDHIGESAKKMFRRSWVAREGLVIRV